MLNVLISVFLPQLLHISMEFDFSLFQDKKISTLGSLLAMLSDDMLCWRLNCAQWSCLQGKHFHSFIISLALFIQCSSYLIFWGSLSCDSFYIYVKCNHLHLLLHICFNFIIRYLPCLYPSFPQVGMPKAR